MKPLAELGSPDDSIAPPFLSLETPVRRIIDERSDKFRLIASDMKRR